MYSISVEYRIDRKSTLNSCGRCASSRAGKGAQHCGLIGTRFKSNIPHDPISSPPNNKTPFAVLLVGGYRGFPPPRFWAHL